MRLHREAIDDEKAKTDRPLDAVDGGRDGVGNIVLSYLGLGEIDEARKWGRRSSARLPAVCAIRRGRQRDPELAEQAWQLAADRLLEYQNARERIRFDRG